MTSGMYIYIYIYIYIYSLIMGYWVFWVLAGLDRAFKGGLIGVVERITCVYIKSLQQIA